MAVANVAVHPDPNHKHISPERISELKNGTMTEEENDKMNNCDYCCESILLGQDVNEYDAARKRKTLQ